MKKNTDFDFTGLPPEVLDSDIRQEDFVLQQADSTIHEQKFQTKPTTFLKDSLRRFRKNKSSVVAAYILGALILLAIFVPIFNTNDVSNAANSALKNLEPKLFNSGGFWDGTLTVRHKEVDPNNNFYPDPDLYLSNGVSNIQKEGEGFTSIPNKFGKGGYVQTGFFGGQGTEKGYLTSTSAYDFSDSDDSVKGFTLDLEASTLTLESFVVADEEMLSGGETVPENYKLGLTSLEFVYEDNSEEYVIELVSPQIKHTVGESGGEAKINLSEYILARSNGVKTFTAFAFRFVTEKPADATPEDHICSLVKKFVISTTNTDDPADYPKTLNPEKVYFSKDTDPKTGLHGISFDDAMQSVICSDEVEYLRVIPGENTKKITYTNPGYWNAGPDTQFIRKIHQAKAYFATFTYDSYKATLGQRSRPVSNTDFYEYASESKKYINFDIECTKVAGKYVITHWEFEILNEAKCPIVVAEKNSSPVPETTAEARAMIEVTGEDIVTGQYTFSVNTDVVYYKYLGYDSMPKYLFGTDKTGRDMFKYVFEGLRNSLILGVITFVVCFSFGLLWGAVSGYFGGAVDLVMERFTDILSGVPWIVVMTIVVLKAGSSIGTFAFALCLTGWIGTASTTRTQFYRFRGREYVLASRTLGASDARLIAKHILPNAMGTIITGAVLMIPSVIFSEATISYLGLGFKNLSSLGVILSSNQSELYNHPYQLIFPSVVIALVMISFNLFGNGLRDAINPSLKGEGE